MNFIKRGFHSLWVKKGRSVILIAVFSAILVFVLAGMTIQSAANKATENAKKSVGATVTLSVNRENMFKQMREQQDESSSETESSDASSESSTSSDRGKLEMTPVKIKDAKQIAALAGVKSYSFQVSTSASETDDFTPISTSTSGSSTMQTGGKIPGGMSQGDFQIVGVSSSAAYSTFSDGDATLTSGTAITAADEDTNNVLLNNELAEENNLKVGDTFKIKDVDDQEVTLTVKGIYKLSSSSEASPMSTPENQIITYYTMANTIKGSDSTNTIDSAVYNLENPKDTAAFVKKAEKLIDTDTYSVSSNDQMYQQMLTPLNNVSKFAQNIIILVAVAGVVILTLIVMLMIRERKYEIGVLLSLGESRFKILLQFFTEITVCMILALGIATVSGGAVGNAVGQQLLSQETTTSQTSNSQQMGGGQAPGSDNGGAPSGMPGGRGSQATTKSAELKKLNVSVSTQQILMLAGMGWAIALLSIIISSIGILRLNPKKILIS